MAEAFEILKQFFVGASYSVFAVGCVLAIVSDQVNYLTFFTSFMFALFFLIFSWVCAMAARVP